MPANNFEYYLLMPYIVIGVGIVLSVILEISSKTTANATKIADSVNLFKSLFIDISPYKIKNSFGMPKECLVNVTIPPLA
jgi:hypothetical protein